MDRVGIVNEEKTMVVALAVGGRLQHRQRSSLHRHRPFYTTAEDVVARHHYTTTPIY
jgi:hypothetical protein